MALATAVSATTFKVAVGQSGLTYSPNDTTAAVGDTIEFSFFPANRMFYITMSMFSDHY
jgi:plastocyanin